MGWKPDPTPDMGNFRVEMRADTFRVYARKPWPTWVGAPDLGTVRMIGHDGDVMLAEFPFESIESLRAALTQVDACLAWRSRGDGRTPRP